jgi:hypothetical protein
LEGEEKEKGRRREHKNKGKRGEWRDTMTEQESKSLQGLTSGGRGGIEVRKQNSGVVQRSLHQFAM